jgi:hypothetical protein
VEGGLRAPYAAEERDDQLWRLEAPPGPTGNRPLIGIRSLYAAPSHCSAGFTNGPYGHESGGTARTYRCRPLLTE